MLKWVLITVGTMVGGIVTVGLPGAAVVALSAPLLMLVYGADFWSRLGDKAWPLALLVTLVWPLALWPGYVAAFGYLGHLSRWGKIGAYVGLLYLWGVLVSLICYKVAEKWL